MSLGIFVAAALFISDDVKVREHVLDENGNSLTEVVTNDITGEQVTQFVTEDVKSTRTTIPFVKSNEFDYEWLVAFTGDAAKWLKWVVYALAIILIVTAVSNAANLTDGIDGLAAGSSAMAVAVSKRADRVIQRMSVSPLHPRGGARYRCSRSRPKEISIETPVQTSHDRRPMAVPEPVGWPP